MVWAARWLVWTLWHLRVPLALEWPGVASGSGVVKETGGDPKTDQASLVCETLTDVGMPATCPPYRPGRLASATAMSSDPVPTAVLDFSLGSADPDEFSTVAACDELLDGFPSISEDLDGLPRCESTVFTPILHIAENSERLRESDFGVQIVPASGSPSELSALSLAV